MGRPTLYAPAGRQKRKNGSAKRNGKTVSIQRQVSGGAARIRRRSARSDRQVAAICRHIDDTLRVEDDRRPLSIEGNKQNHWVVVDYGDAVVHIFYEPVRTFYELERLWADAPELELDVPDDQQRPLDPYGDA